MGEGKGEEDGGKGEWESWGEGEWGKGEWESGGEGEWRRKEPGDSAPRRRESSIPKKLPYTHTPTPNRGIRKRGLP